MVTVRAEVVAVAEELVQAADRWRSAYEEWEAAVARRERKMARASVGSSQPPGTWVCTAGSGPAAAGVSSPWPTPP